MGLYDGCFLVRKKYVRKTNICGGPFDFIVDKKSDIPKEGLEWRIDGNMVFEGDLIFVRSESAFYKVKAKEVIMTKANIELEEAKSKEKYELYKKKKQGIAMER